MIYMIIYNRKYIQNYNLNLQGFEVSAIYYSVLKELKMLYA